MQTIFTYKYYKINDKTFEGEIFRDLLGSLIV